MNKLNQIGVRISQYPQAPVNISNHKKKLELHHSLISWAPAYYGLTTVNKNYQVPLSSLRQDLLGYIGINNSKPGWRNYLTFWQGDWYNTDRTKSYVYTWSVDWKGDDDYIFNKHGLDVEYDKTNNINRVFILNDAPLPLQETYTPVNAINSSNHGEDPNPNNVKLVSKKYIDDRHNGVRKIEKAPATNSVGKLYGSELNIRPYTCFYQYSNPPAQNTLTGIQTINITDNEVLEDGRTIKDVLRHNRLKFYIRLTNNDSYYKKDGSHFHNLQILVNGKDEALWSYKDELSQILRDARQKETKGTVENPYKGYIFIRCEAQYINNKFTVTCSNFWGRGKNSKRILKVDFGNSSTRQINLKLALHENESFFTEIPQQSVPSANIQQYYIKLDATGLNDFHEYTWNYYLMTPTHRTPTESTKERAVYDYDDIIFETGNTPIMWAMEDGYNIAPKLEPNKLYCFQFTKIFDDLLIGRIKYFVNMVKKA